MKKGTSNLNKRLFRLRRLIRQITPPVVFTLLKKVSKKNQLHFITYQNWEDAVRASIGYDEDNIIEKIRHSAKLVFDGEAIYERDSVIFDEIQYSWPLLASLLFASSNNNSLRVIDFGGAFGTTFQQNRRFILNLSKSCQWRVVEQPKFVRIGKEEFTNKFLSFYNTIEEATLDGVDVVLFGGSICYVPNPYIYLNAAVGTKASYVIFDRTPITADINDTFAVQKVPASIYKASYPIRNFNYKNLIKPFELEYELIEQWVCDLQADSATTAIGLIFKRKSN